MALTKEFADTVKSRLEGDGRFRLALLKESMDSLLEGDVGTGKALLRDYVNATIGFESLAELMGTPAKSLHRMLGDKGNPRAENIFRMLAELQKAERVDAKVQFLKGGARAGRAAELAVHEAPAGYAAKPPGDVAIEGARRWARQRAARHRKKD